jgi:thioredoxin-related protein
VAAEPFPSLKEKRSIMVLRSKIPAALAALACSALLSLTGADAAQLLVIESAHCPYCLAWEREIGGTYEKSEAGKLAPLRRLDIRGERPADLARVKLVHITPTFVLVEDGREIGRIEGYSGAQSFWPRLRTLLARLRQSG